MASCNTRRTCQRDIATHEYNLALFMCMTSGGQLFTSMQRTLVHLARQSQLMEEEARELAYLVLKTHGPSSQKTV